MKGKTLGLRQADMLGVLYGYMWASQNTEPTDWRPHNICTALAGFMATNKQQQL